jgi:HAD superfamily hydrolase (TIGR01490 family)
MEYPMIAAFFDVDGTLYTANMWRGLMQYAAAHGRKMRTRWYFGSLIPLYLLRKLRLISEENFRKPWVSQLPWIIQNWRAEQAEAAFKWIAREYLPPSARNDIIAILREHVAQGHAVILVSAMLRPVLQEIAKSLGATGVVGTQIEIKDARISGRIDSPVCMGAQKEQLARAFLESRNLDIDFAASYAYADSFSDLPLFEMVGNPVAVYPDAELAPRAREKGWKVIP